MSVVLVIDFANLLLNRDYIVEGLVEGVSVACIISIIPKVVIVCNSTDTVFRVNRKQYIAIIKDFDSDAIPTT